VNAIASEIHEELGPDATLDLAPVAEPSSVSQPAPVASVLVDQAVWQMHFRNIEERIDRLEKTVGTAVDLLRGISPDKAKKPGTPAGR
jgi:hypothetical protein